MYNNSGGMYSGDYAMGYGVASTEDSHHGPQYHGYEEHGAVSDHFSRSGGSPARGYNSGFYVEGYQEYSDMCQRDCQKLPQEEGFFHLGHSHQSESFNIITSNGLSYTDLDYGASGYQKTEPNFERLQYPHQKHHEEDPHQDHLHHHHHHHHEDGFVLHNNAYHHQMASSLPDTGQSFPQESSHFQGVKEELGAHGMPLEYHDQRHHRPSPQQAVPTYKWMQVKRNVPKPGRSILMILLYCIVLP